MQRDKGKLKEAHYRRLLMKFLALLSVLSLAPYSFYLVSDGFRNFLELGHLWLVIALVLFALSMFIGKPIYKLENPFLHSRDCKEPRHDK